MSKTRSITPNPPADFTTNLGDYKTLQPFRYWCQKVLPLVYDDSLSYYELLCKVIDYLNKTMEDVETLHGDVNNLHTAYEQLQSYVNNYFSTLDVQEEINNKLDAMAKDGTLTNLIKVYVDPLIDAQNNKIEVLENRMDTFTSLPNGSTVADAELIDIRVPAYGFNNGKNYPNAGDAVRGQITTISKDLSKQKAVKIQYLSDRSEWEQNKYWTPSLVQGEAEGYYCTKLNGVKSGEYTIIGLSPDFCFIIPEKGAPKSFKSVFGGFSENKAKTITLENCDLLLTSYKNSALCMMCDGNKIPETYKYGIFDFIDELVDVVEKISKVETINITVGLSSKADFSDLYSAIKSITDSSINKIYNIMLENGTYNILMDMTSENGYLPDYVNIIGISGDRDKVLIIGSNDENADANSVINNSTLNIRQNNNIKNVTITAKNCRYAVHSESSGAFKGWKQIIENCKFIHYGNTGNAKEAWSSCHAWGEGASSGSYAQFDNVDFEAPYYPAYIHEPPTEEGITPYYHVFNNCNFTNNVAVSGTMQVAMEIDNTRNNGCVHRVEFNNCNFGEGMLAIMGNYEIDVRVHGCNDVPIRRGDNTTQNNYYKNFPNTNLTTKKLYLGNKELTGGEILAYKYSLNDCDIATTLTPKEMIAGVYYGSGASTNDIINVSKSMVWLNNINFGKNLFVGNDGKISDTGKIPILFGLGRFAKFL